jgi:hypothetical protein|tara:strand:+ start:1545 stop:1976 length:432 start_codon:yes stop_codon:yes gene_type:complete
MITYFNEKTKFDVFIGDCINALFYVDSDADPEAFIDIEYLDQMENNHAGLCTGDKDIVKIQISLNYSFDCGDKIKYCDQETASNIAHELVHARQFIRGEMNDYDYVWKGFDYEGIEYAETPWEVEAYGMEKVLVDLFWENNDD